MTGFDQTWADRTVQQLAERGVEFAPGLTDADTGAAGAALGSRLPPELALLLQVAVPVSAKWARWVEGPEVVASDAQQWIHGSFAFDIEHAGYWHPHLGERPDDLAAAIAKALAVVDAMPPLFPIYAHRFLVSQPADGTGAVLSVWQAVDSIFYGNDLADYLAREFGIERPSWAADDAPRVPGWEDLFDLFGEGHTDETPS